MPPRLSQCLQTRRDIDAITEDVVFLNDHVTEVDANAEPDPALFGHFRLTVDHPALDLDRTAHGIDHARELGKEAVAGVFHGAAAVFSDFRINYLAEVGLKAAMRAFLVLAHQSRIPGHIGGEDGGEAAGRGHGGAGHPVRKFDTLNYSTGAG
jgi:hypothetical protein